jgi:hypothetical protein
MQSVPRNGSHLLSRPLSFTKPPSARRRQISETSSWLADVAWLVVVLGFCMVGRCNKVKSNQGQVSLRDKHLDKTTSGVVNVAQRETRRSPARAAGGCRGLFGAAPHAAQRTSWVCPARPSGEQEHSNSWALIRGSYRFQQLELTSHNSHIGLELENVDTAPQHHAARLIGMSRPNTFQGRLRNTNTMTKSFHSFHHVSYKYKKAIPVPSTLVSWRQD